MKSIQQTIGIISLSAALMFTATGCDTAGNGAMTGGVVGAGLGAIIGGATGNPALGAAIGAASGVVAGAIIGQINADQKAKLQAQSPQTLQTIQHNDAVYQQQQQAAQAAPASSPQSQASAAPAAPAEQPTPLTVDDVRALDSAGVKKEVIIAEIGRSKSVYTPADITALQQTNPNVDPAVIDCMKKTMAT